MIATTTRTKPLKLNSDDVPLAAGNKLELAETPLAVGYWPGTVHTTSELIERLIRTQLCWEY